MVAGLPIDRYAVRLPASLFRMLGIFLHVELDRIGNIKVKEENIARLRSLFDQYYERYGGYQLKSKKFLDDLYKLDD